MSDAIVTGVPVRRPLLRLAALGRPVRSTLLLAVLAGAATVGCGIALLAVSGFLLARASQHPNIVALSIAVVAVRALGIGRGLARYVERLAGHDAALRVLADLRASVYCRLEQLAPAGLSGFQRGDLLARFIADVDSVQDLFIRGVTPPLVAVLAGGGSVVLAAAVWSPAGAVLAGGLILAGVVLPLLSGYLADRSAEESVRARAELAVTSVDLIDGAAELVALGAEDVVLDRLAAADRTLTERARRLSVVAAIGTSGAAVVSGLTVFGVLLTSVAAAGQGALGRVPLAVLVLTALAAFEATSALPAAATALVGTRAAARRVFAVLDAPDPVHDSPASTASMPQGPLTLTLRGVAARHSGSNRDVLRGLDLEVRPGSKVAIVGASGAGKSTLINVLLRFLDLSAGQYLINGVDATQVPAEKLRRRISGCTADPHIFDSTVRANLALARPTADDAALLRVLSVVKLDKWLAGLPDGLDTAVGAHGLAMSGGERQRIAVARALLANPDVVVFDEPTSHLDAGTADALMADLMAAVAGRTVVMITHDRRGLSAMDEVYELRGGCLRRVGADGGASDVVRLAGSARP